MSRMKKPKVIIVGVKKETITGVTVTHPGVGYLTPPTKEDPETAAGPLLKPIPRWGTVASLYDYHSPLFSALLEIFGGIRVMFRGYKSCHNCWHRGRVGPFAACYHPQGIVECRPDMAWPGSINADEARFFLQRPSFWFRRRHQDWRKMRFAAMKLAPVEQEAGDPTMGQSAGAALSAITRRAYVSHSQTPQWPSSPTGSLSSPPPPPPAAGLGGTIPVPLLSRKP
jgi:hypothetical protein